MFKKIILITLLISSVQMNVHGASYQDIIVMIDSKFPATGKIEYGAGIIVEETPQRTVIITALHVVENELAEQAKDIKIEFRTLLGKQFSATTTRYYSDPQLDLAVLFIDRISAPDMPYFITDTTKQAISPSTPKELIGTNVQVIGVMGRKKWATGVKSDHVIKGDPYSIVVSTDEARAGASGGGVFDTFGRLIGLSSRVDTSTGTLIVIPIETILKKLNKWGFEIGISNAKAGSSSSELLKQFKDSFQVKTEYLQNPKTSDSFNKLGGPLFANRVKAYITPQLITVVSKIEIYYSVVTGTTKHLLLKPPELWVDTTEYPLKLDGEAWISFTDGRRLGPFQIKLDFETSITRAAEIMGDQGKRVLEHSRSSLALEKNNARLYEESRSKVLDQFDKVREENLRQNDKMKTKQLIENFPNWDIRCSLKYSIWNCQPPLFVFNGMERLIHSIKIGASASDLSVDIPILPANELRSAFVTEVISLLQTSDDIIIRMQLNTGEVLGPKTICHVKKFKRDERSFCSYN